MRADAGPVRGGLCGVARIKAGTPGMRVDREERDCPVDFFARRDSTACVNVRDANGWMLRRAAAPGGIKHAANLDFLVSDAGCIVHEDGTEPHVA